MRIQFGLSYFTIPSSDLDEVIPEGALREKYAFSYTDENEEEVVVSSPTWREAINNINPEMLNNAKRIFNGVEYQVIIGCFRNLNGENRAAKNLGLNRVAPEYTLFSYVEFEEFNWDSQL